MKASLLRMEIIFELHTLCQFDKGSKANLPIIHAGQGSLIDKLNFKSSGPPASRVISRALLQGLAERVNAGSLTYEALAAMDNDEVMASLIKIPGIGRWTADMFLIIGLKRPDVLALGDAGLQRAAKMLYTKASSNGNALEKVSERWKPYRSVASWYLWRHIDKA
jgi:hypothetical protein